MPTVEIGYILIFANSVERDLGRISADIAQLPTIDNSETGALNRELSIVRDLIRDLKREIDNQNMTIIRRIFDDISTHYTDIQSILSRLLERILQSFELSRPS